MLGLAVPEAGVEGQDEEGRGEGRAGEGGELAELLERERTAVQEERGDFLRRGSEGGVSRSSGQDQQGGDNSCLAC